MKSQDEFDYFNIRIPDFVRATRRSIANSDQMSDEENPKFALFFTDFKKLPAFQKLQALHLATQNFSKTLKIGVYANEWFNQFRITIKKKTLQMDSFGSKAQEWYWTVRSCLTLKALVDLFSRFDLETRNTRDDKHKKTLEEKDVGNKSPRQSQQERVQLLEFFEEIFDEIFNSCEWGKDLQDEAASLKTSFDNAQISTLMDVLINTARHIDVPRLAYTAFGVISLFKGEGLNFNNIESYGLPSPATEKLQNLLPSKKYEK